VTNLTRSRSTAVEAVAAATPSTPPTTTAAPERSMLGRSLPRVQAVVGTLAGIASIVGAVFSLVQIGRPAKADTGELVAIVQAAGSRRGVSDARIEVLTTQDAIVATLTPDATGRATRELREGVYVVRVSHPRYAADVRRVQVLPQQTVEVRASLRAGSSSPIERAVDSGVNAVRRALRF
jgi:carboxypeptidase family protein